ncbi:hypothetical protein B0F90DRAFT_1811576 [Multifurca ochricompacta]|uniref:Uncharacterized protein n=1 Tax=Multifurca ochricompacta TaxID=376703 RepID=A0AAD4LYV6_9AGAM|nr:hypothetical protein B0F90DRAFT_1811576 [Multifurca ochricompacta]
MSSPIIDAKTLETASNIQVFNGKGEKVRFGDIFANQKGVVVFIRHFFCGQYVSQLTTVREDALKEASAKIVLVGCGDWALIENYKKDTDFKGDVYANPDRKLYDTLGMISNLNSTPKGEDKRSYVKRSMLNVTLWSIWRGPLKSPSHIGKQGNISQNGGDFVFGPGMHLIAISSTAHTRLTMASPLGLACSYSSRMKHTEDHVEVADLMKAVGVTYP